MNRALYFLFYVICIIAGLAGFAADTYLNVEYVGFENSGPVLTIVVIAVCSALSLTAATMAWKAQKYVVFLLCTIGFLSAVVWSAPVSLSRISASIDIQTLSKENHQIKRDMLERAYNDVKATREKESKNGGCKKNCQALLDREQNLLKELTDLGNVKTGDPAAKRLAAVFTFIDEKTIETIVPISAIIALTCLMNGLFVFGVSSILEKRNLKKQIHIPKDKIMDMNPEVDRILTEIANSGPMSIGELAKKTGNREPLVSSYMSELEKRGIVNKVRQGNRKIITLTK
jgi:ribosomal protein S25